MDDRPKTLKEYTKWLAENHRVEVGKQARTHFETVADRIAKDFLGSPFWQELSEQNLLRDFDEQYKQSHDNYQLVIDHHAPQLVTKSFDSFFLKTYRRNILQNEDWPQPPRWPGHDPSWLLPSNWLCRINDIVRTCFVVKYLDGVKVLVDHLESKCKEYGLACHSYFVSGEDGYYAAHLYIRQEFEVPKITFDTELVEIEIELQITTQLQDVIRRLLHVHYEEKRKRHDPPEVQWQWDYKSNEFGANYLGHILHYAEGMIVEVRDRQKEN